ncbi:MAG TPA: hypothetical protein VFN57_17655 [Thermomicrobiaceae bacterium]|nr:hypothetical protein [Thermomicrobiaceae bacterium]
MLRPGGRVVTQQVDRDNWRELRPFFPGKQDFGDHFVTYGDAFAAAGLHVVGERHSRLVAYATLGDFVLLLLVAPWEIPGFDPLRDIDALLAFADSCRSPEGIVVTESRYLLVAQKPPR